MLKECPKVGDVIGATKFGPRFEILWAKPGPLAGEFYAVTSMNGEVGFSRNLRFESWSVIKPKIVRYINIYSYGCGRGDMHKTREDANFSASQGRKACIRVEYEEDQFDV